MAYSQINPFFSGTLSVFMIYIVSFCIHFFFCFTCNLSSSVEKCCYFDCFFFLNEAKTVGNLRRRIENNSAKLRSITREHKTIINNKNF